MGLKKKEDKSDILERPQLRVNDKVRANLELICKKFKKETFADKKSPEYSEKKELKKKVLKELWGIKWLLMLIIIL